MTGVINYKTWALDLCSLLDEIEANEDDPERLAELLKYRFEIARNHGMTVTIEGLGEVGHA